MRPRAANGRMNESNANKGTNLGGLIMGNIFNLMFAALREGGTNEVSFVHIMAQRGSEIWRTKSFVPGEFAKLMLSSHVFPPAVADNLFRRVQQQVPGPVTEENIALTEEQMQFLGLRRAGSQCGLAGE